MPQGENLQPPIRRRLALLGAEAEQVVVHVGARAEDEYQRGDADGIPVGRLKVEGRGLCERRSQVSLRKEPECVGVSIIGWLATPSSTTTWPPSQARPLHRTPYVAHLHENPHREDSLLLADSPQKQQLLELREAATVPSPLPRRFLQMRCVGVEELCLECNVDGVERGNVHK